jgi:hypothetical protein
MAPIRVVDTGFHVLLRLRLLTLLSTSFVFQSGFCIYLSILISAHFSPTVGEKAIAVLTSTVFAIVISLVSSPLEFRPTAMN